MDSDIRSETLGYPHLGTRLHREFFHNEIVQFNGEIQFLYIPLIIFGLPFGFSFLRGHIYTPGIRKS